MATVLKPPTLLSHITTSRTVFLAGSIEMGAAEDWQTYVTTALQPIPDLTILNPRRDEWDASWEQSIDNPIFRKQVEWELDAQDLATVIMMYFAPTTKAPITLLEFGLFAASDKLVVCCPDGYWRKGNIEVVCDRYEIPLVNALDELLEAAQRRF